MPRRRRRGSALPGSNRHDAFAMGTASRSSLNTSSRHQRATSVAVAIQSAFGLLHVLNDRLQGFGAPGPAGNVRMELEWHVGPA